MLKQLDTLIGLAVVFSLVSLLITIVTQMVSAFLGLRGRNLANALEAMLHRLDPQINQEVASLGRELANDVLTRPAISDSMLSMSRSWPLAWKRASAIRPHELLVMLQSIAGETTPSDQPPKTAAEAAARVLKRLDTPTPATTEALSALKAKLPELAAAHGAAVVERFNAATNVALSNLERSFNSAQDRARQWFAMHARIVTVVASALAAFILQLDAFNLVRRISSEPDLRARLVSGADGTGQQSLPSLNEVAPVSPSIHTNVLAQLEPQHAGVTSLLADRPPVSTLTEADAWIRRCLADSPLSPQINGIIAQYNAAAQAESRKRLDDLSQEIGAIGDRLNKTGVEMIPSPYPGLLSGNWSWPWPHLAGILASAALLSLGAPFWFNLLKSLANLRPLLAQQIEKNPTLDGSSQT